MLTVKISPLRRSYMRSTSASRQVVTLMGPGVGNRPFRPDGGALSADFKAHGELWLNDRRCDMLPVETRGIGILFQDALLFDAFSVGQNLMLALPAHIVGAPAATRSSRPGDCRAGKPLHQRSGDPFRRRARRSACCAPFSPSRRHCCSTSRSVDWIKRCAPHSGRGYSRSLASAGSRWCWSRMMRTIFRPAAR